MKTDGSGVDQELRLAQQLKETLATGATQEDTIKLNQIIAKQLRFVSLNLRHVCTFFDNFFFVIIQGNDESCLSILNNFYNDGLKWVSKATNSNEIQY